MKEVKECFYADHIDPGSKGNVSDVEKREKNHRGVAFTTNSIGSFEKIKVLLWI